MGAQKKSGEMLRTLKNILNEMDAYVYVSDIETDEILFVNCKIKENFGIDYDTTGHICWQVLQTGIEGRCPFCPLQQLLANPGSAVEWEEHNTRTGRWYRDVDSIIDWVDGRKVHMQYAVDITESKMLAAETEKAREVLQNILNGIDAYVYVSDMATDEILFINDKMKRGFGLGDDAVGRVCWQALQQGFTERCSFCPNHTLEKDPAATVEWEEHNTATGRWYKNVDSVIEWTDGRKVHMQHSTDITGVMEAQNETAEVKKRLETALTASGAGVWELDFRRGMMEYDDTCALLFGLDRRQSSISLEELIAHLRDVMAGENAEAVLRGLESKDPYKNAASRDFQLQTPDGGLRFVRNFGNTVRNSRGEAVRVIGMCMDITSHVQMERELTAARDAAEDANHAKSQFLSNMSHEIRTPMNAIIGMADLLVNEPLTDRQKSHMRDIRMSSTALLSIINDILDFSKIEAGKLQLIPVDYSLAELLHNLDSMFTISAGAKGITFSMVLEGGLPPCLYGDDIRLRQALINILGNAVKFTKKGGVTMRAYTEGGMLCFDIADTGIGIRKGDLAKIYNDFDQLDEKNNRNITGTGLGLSITRNLVAMMGGTMDVESKYGKGTTFTLRVPLVLGDESKLEEPPESDELVSAPFADVLVVDDNEINLNVAYGLLSFHDIECRMAHSGREALDMVQKSHYDIVFMDQMMPEMNGVETTTQLRKLCALRNETPPVVVALTADAIDGARENLIGAGMDDYLSKPIDSAELNRVLRKWLPPEKMAQ